MKNNTENESEEEAPPNMKILGLNNEPPHTSTHPRVDNHGQPVASQTLLVKDLS